MAQLMLINPARRPSKRRKTTARRRKASPAQLRALAKARRARAGLSSNPSPRRRRRTSLRAVARSTRRRARRNPIGMGGVMGMLTGAVWGAGGAFAVNYAFNMLPLPATMKTGMMGTVSQLGLAVALGMLGKKVIGRNAGKMAEGAMTVTVFQALQNMLPVSAGGTSVAGLGYMSPGLNAGGSMLPNMSVPNFAGMGEYVSGMGGMGEYVYQ